MKLEEVVSRVVCWKCGRGGQKGDAPLKKVSATNYVCLNDLQYGAPDKEGQSDVYFNKKEEKKQSKLEPKVEAAISGVVEKVVDKEKVNTANE